MIENIDEWAVATFANSELGDKRRTKRLVKMASSMATHVGKSVVKSSPDSASIEGSYRLIRNDKVNAEPIAESGFDATVQQAQKYDVLLALEDTTSLTYKRRNLPDKLGYTCNSLDSKFTGYMAHSILLYAPKEQRTVGLIAQHRWVRKEENFGERKNNQKRAYETKESFKWETASKSLSERLGNKMQDCISVCDREADVIEYLSYKQKHNQRFVVRVKSNRPLKEEGRLFDFVSAQEVNGCYTVDIPQRGGRKARRAKLTIQYSPVNVMAPERKQSTYPPLQVYAVKCQEIQRGDTENKKDKLNWVLLTTEPVHTTEDALKVVSYYEARWKVELFHKVWKTEGTNVEDLKMHTFQALEKVAVIQAFIACRLMQLKDMGDSEYGDSTPCTLCLSDIQWKLLYRSAHQSKPLPKKPPSIRWAYHAIAKLGGWYDSKRTGRVSWKTLHEGLDKLETMQMTYELMKAEM